MYTRTLSLLALALSLTLNLKAQIYSQLECVCMNNQTTPNNGQFGERIDIYSQPGETWSIIEVSGLYSTNSPEPPANPIPLVSGEQLKEESLGVYRLNAIRMNNTSWSMTVSNGVKQETLTNYHLCQYAELQINVPEQICINDILDIDFTSSRGPISDINWRVNAGSFLSPSNMDTVLYEAPSDTSIQVQIQVSAYAENNDFEAGTACLVSNIKELNIIDDEVVCASVLPVRYQYFNLMQRDNAVILDWKTTFEINNMGWIIERSIDGQDWDQIGEVSSKEEASTYSFTDEDTPKSSLLYYRLQQRDWDESVSYSEVKKINLPFKENEWKVYPNPSSSIFRIETTEEEVQVQAFDQSGREVMIQYLQNGQYQIDKQGIFILRIASPNKIIHHKIIIQ